jgi:sensor histidine kinase regulating citrate/malate metabolism
MNLIIAGAIVAVAPISIEDVLDYTLYFILLNLAGLLPLLVLAILLRRLDLKNVIKFLNKKEMVLIIIVIVLSGISITVLQFQGEAVSYGYIYNAVAAIGGIGIIGVIILFMIRSSKVNEMKQVQKVQDKLVAQQQLYYDNLLKQDRETRQFRHDIKEHFQSISSLIKSEELPELQDYVSGLIGEFDTVKGDFRPTETGVEIINVILYDLEGQYKELGIEVTWEEVIPAGTKIANNDLSRLFSNLLKNSFEAAAKCKEKRFVKVQTSSDGANFYLLITNSYIGGLVANGSQLQTSKRDKLNHGYGMKIIHEIVGKYGGYINVSGEEGVYKVEIMFMDIME